MALSTASAPGKVLLIGEYAVLERGNSAFSVAIERRVHASAGVGEFEVELPDFGKKTMLVNSGGSFAAPGQDPVFKFAVASANAVAEHAGELQPFLLRTESDLGFRLHGGMKSGIGSSAAATVSMCAALLKFAGAATDKRTIELVSQRAHFLAQGAVGSGFDVATAVYGTIIYRRFSPERVSGGMWGLKKAGLDSHIEYAELPKGWRLVLGFSGKSASTVSLVGKMDEYKRANPGDYSAAMGRICAANAVAMRALKRLALDASDSGAEGELALSIGKARELLIGLGGKAGISMEPEPAGRMLKLAMDAGAVFSKLPGAGGGDCALAVCRDVGAARDVLRAWQGAGAYSFEAIPAKAGVRVA